MWPTNTLCITIAANIAKTAILTFDACFPDSVVGFISGGDVNQIYIHYWFTFFQKILEEQAPLSCQKNINLKILSELNVMLPPLALQNQFATFVEKVDQTKASIKKSLEQLGTLKASLMQQYFG
jgi:type I restriction enzyme S subunit